MVKKEVNIPLWLTIGRLILSPLLLPLLMVYLLPLNALWINTLLAVLFLLFGLTDFFDGYLARRYQQETGLGKILDPIADKSLVYSSLIALVAINKLYFYWAIILIGREFFVMGMRIVALEHSVSIAVSLLSKVKTAVQMAMIIFIIVNPYQQLGFSGAPAWNAIEGILIGVTLLLSLYTASEYYRSFWKKMDSSGELSADEHDAQDAQ